MAGAEWKSVIGVILTGLFMFASSVTWQVCRRSIVAPDSAVVGQINCKSPVHLQIPSAIQPIFATFYDRVMQLRQTMAQGLAPHACGPKASPLPHARRSEDAGAGGCIDE